MKVGWEPKTFKADKVLQVNPPKMEKFDDVSNMTYLNEAAVLWNLKARYVAKLIYVSIARQPFFLLQVFFFNNKCSKNIGRTYHEEYLYSFIRFFWLIYHFDGENICVFIPFG